MLGRAAASISCGRIAALALLLATFGLSPALCPGDEAKDAKPLAVFPMGPDRIPFVTLSFGGRDYRCVLDTGSTTTALNSRFAADLGSPAAERRGHKYYAVDEMWIGKRIRLRRLMVPCLDLDQASLGVGAQIDGIVGMDVLSRFVVSFNFDESVVSIHAPDYQPLARTDVVQLVCNPRPFTKVAVSGHELNMLIDSGSDSDLRLPRALVDAISQQGLAQITSGEALGVGMGGWQASRFGYAAEARWGGFRHDWPDFVDTRDPRERDAVGMRFLARYNSTLTFAKNEIVLEKSKWHDVHWWPILRGVQIGDLGGRAMVFSVTSGSPAFRAGIRPDDEFDNPPDPSLWQAALPLVQNVRKPGEANFSPVQVEADERLLALPPRNNEDRQTAPQGAETGTPLPQTADSAPTR